MTASPRIVVVGSANTDMVIGGRSLPQPGETVLGGTFWMASGGKGANQAVAAARLGGDVGFVARVGNDLFGERALRDYAAEGIDTTYVETVADVASGVALILVDEHGENLISVAPGANEALSVAAVEAARDWIEGADVLLLQLETPLESVAAAARRATAAGTTVVLDPAPARALADELLRDVDVLTPNESEARRLTGVDVVDFDSACAAGELLRSRGVDSVLVTLGRLGCAVVTDAGNEWVRPPGVEAVDTTAAGDTFNGALARGLESGLELRPSVRLGVRAAALAVTRRGAQPSMPRADELGLDLSDRPRGD